MSDHLPFLGSPGDEIGKTIPTQSSTQITHLPANAFLCTGYYVYARHPGVQEEALMNKRCIVKGYHLHSFEVNVSEVFTANKKRGECRKAFKVVNHHGQLHLQSELADHFWPLHANISVLIFLKLKL